MKSTFGDAYGIFCHTVTRQLDQTALGQLQSCSIFDSVNLEGAIFADTNLGSPWTQS